jgi:2-phospho-L-lactate guanylyltransferase
MRPPRFAALVPVKPPARGKSRLLELGATDRARLAAGFALDTVAACLATHSVEAVLGVTDDAAFAARLRGIGAEVVPDGVAGDLNESLRLAALEAARRWPGLVPVAVCADLPALQAADLETALSACTGTPAFVSDVERVGTTAYVAPTGDFRPRFGPGSRVAHLAQPALELAGELTTLRRDVDDLASLLDAQRLGLGRHTAAAVAGMSALPTH